MKPSPRILLLLILFTFFSLFSSSAPAGSRLINGTPVKAGTFPQVVRINTNGSGCTATLVGRNVLITAAHCAKTNDVSNFKLAGKSYQARITRSALYPGKDHDVSLGVLTENIPSDINPISVGGVAEKGTALTILGYGCTQPGGTGGNDGVLRIGPSVITGFSNYDFVSKKAGGGALCYGDSGGPAMTENMGRLVILGINSKGNIKDTNYNTRLDSAESQAFLTKMADEKNLEICGINAYCQ